MSRKNDERDNNALEGICSGLPLPTKLNPDLYRLVDILCSTLVINTELKDITILDLVRPRLCIGWRKSDVIQERP